MSINAIDRCLLKLCHPIVYTLLSLRALSSSGRANIANAYIYASRLWLSLSACGSNHHQLLNGQSTGPNVPNVQVSGIVRLACVKQVMAKGARHHAGYMHDDPCKGWTIAQASSLTFLHGFPTGWASPVKSGMSMPARARPKHTVCDTVRLCASDDIATPPLFVCWLKRVVLLNEEGDALAGTIMWHVHHPEHSVHPMTRIRHGSRKAGPTECSLGPPWPLLVPDGPHAFASHALL
jgi:hypothetical protein